MATIFDGKNFAFQKERILAEKVLELKSKNIYPRLASIIVGDDPASVLYVNLKKKAAERIGAELDIYRIGSDATKEDLISLIKDLNEDDGVHGIMVQLPLPDPLKKSKVEILNFIAAKKDVDGLKTDSLYLHPTAKAVIQIIKQSKSISKNICVVGEEGMVGASLIRELKKEGYEITSDSKEADILVSATGDPGIIKGKDVKQDAVVIDVGSPKGDVDFESVSNKASFITPVPGGVGPVTISCLLENLISAC